MDMSFTPQGMPRPYDSLCAWIGNLLELARESFPMSEGGDGTWNP